MGKFNFIETGIKDLYVIEPTVFGDNRGYFMETYNAEFEPFIRHLDGSPAQFVQDNQSASTRGVLRGLHFQKEHPQGKLVRVIRGEVFEINDRTLLAFGGARSTDKYWRIEGQSWWPEEEPTFVDFDNAMKNLEKIDFKPDLIITHEIPLDYKKTLYASKIDAADKTSQLLNSVLYFCPNYGKWYCGHHHVDMSVNDRFRILYQKIEEVKWEEQN